MSVDHFNRVSRALEDGKQVEFEVDVAATFQRTDNGAGVAVVMEAARILAVLGVTPRRTIRYALWSGEEQGTIGSYTYVRNHIATRPPPESADQRALPEFLWPPTWAITPRAARVDQFTWR